MLIAEAWVETGTCARPTCDWGGMHWHWGPRRFRRIADLSPEERIAFDADCRLTNALRGAGGVLAEIATRELELAHLTTALAGSRHPERSITMATYDDPRSDAAQSMTEQEAADGERLRRAGQWVHLLDVTDEGLNDRAANRPLAQTIEDLEQIEAAADDLENLSARLRALRGNLRSAVSMHTSRHDEQREKRLSQGAAKAVDTRYER